MYVCMYVMIFSENFLSVEIFLESKWGLRDRSLFMAGGGGVSPKRKGLGKQNVESVKGWVNEKQNKNKNLFSFPKDDSLKYW